MRIKINNGKEDVIIENPIQLRLPGEGENVLFRFYFPGKYPSVEKDMEIFKKLSNDTLKSITADDLGNLESVNSTFAGLKVQSIELPQSVSIIESRSFLDCAYLEEIEMPTSLKRIENYAFQSCKNLQYKRMPDPNISGDTGELLTELPNSVEFIGDSAFSGCSKLPLKKLPDNLVEVGSYAFSGCSSMEITELPLKLEIVDVHAFDGRKLSASEFPESLRTVRIAAFKSTNITVKTVPKNLKTIPTAMVARSKNITEFTVPATVTSMGEEVFSKCTGLESARIEAPLSSIPSYTFNECEKLQTVDINPENITTIGFYAFSGCLELIRFDFPENEDQLQDIQDYAFNNCTKLLINGKTDLHIPKRLSSLGGYAFYGNDMLTSVEIPDTVKLTGNSYSSNFAYCNNLEEVRFFPGTYKDKFGLRFTTSIPSDIFYNCRKLKNIEIPRRISSISNDVFYNTNLKNIIVDCRITQLSDLVFGSIKNLHSVFLPETVTSVYSSFLNSFSDSNEDTRREVTFFSKNPPTIYSSSVFRSQNVLPSNFAIYVPFHSVEEYNEAATWMTWSQILQSNGTAIIGDKLPWFRKNFLDSSGHEWRISRFADYDTNLTFKIKRVDTDKDLTVKSFSREQGQIVFDDNINGITEEFVFSAVPTEDGYNYSLTSSSTSESISLSEQNTSSMAAIDLSSYTVTALEDEQFYNHTSLQTVILPETLKTIGRRSFYGCTDLRTANLSDSIEEIADFSFYDCWKLSLNLLPNGLNKIGDYAFYNCDELVLESLPDNLEEIGIGSFYDCKNIAVKVLPQNLKVIKDYAFYNCQKMALGSYSQSELREIGAYAFYQNYNLTQMAFPNSLKKIGSYAFAECNNLEIDTFPDSLEVPGSYAFKNCRKLAGVEISKNWKKIPSGLFYGCSSLNFEKFPDWLETVESQAFYNCSSLTNVNFGEKWRTINSATFYNCKNLELTEFPNDMNEPESQAFFNCQKINPSFLPSHWKTINYGTFKNCNKMTLSSLPNGLERLDDYAFENCTNALFTVPSSVKYFGSYCLSNASNVTINEISQEITTIGTYAFQNVNNFRNIVVPKSTTLLSSYALSNCPNLESATFNNNLTYNSEAAFPQGLFSGDVSLKSITVNIPIKPSTIYQETFCDCSSLETIEGVDFSELISVNSKAFRGTKLNLDISFKKSNSAITIGDHAFDDSPNLTFESGSNILDFSDEEYTVSIGSYSFNNTKIKEVKLNNLSHLGIYAFQNCTELEKADLGKVLVPQQGMFSGCSSLTDIILDNTPYVSNSSDLFRKTAIKNIVFPKCERIGGYALGEIASLESVSLPSTVKAISSNAFSDSFGSSDELAGSVVRELTVCSIAPPTISATAFRGTSGEMPTNLDIWIPYWSEDAYRTATNWTYFSSRFKLDKLPFTKAGFSFLYNGEPISLQIRRKSSKTEKNYFVIVKPDKTEIKASSFSRENGIITFSTNMLGEDGVWRLETYFEDYLKFRMSSPSGIVYNYDSSAGLVYEVQNVSSYGFYERSDGFYESTNNGHHNTFSMCRVDFRMPYQADLVIDCINYAESSNDYGVFSYLNDTLTADTSANNAYFSFSGKSSPNIQQVTYYNVPEGEHRIMIKYCKDRSGNYGNDSLRFKIRDDLIY